MNKFIITFLLIFLAGVSCFSQTYMDATLTDQEVKLCSESMSNLSIRGFKFGMTAAEVKKLYSEIKIPYSDLGGLSETETYFIAEKDSMKRVITNAIINKGKYKNLDGLEALSLMFVNYKLTSIFLFYEPSIEWSGTLDFAGQISGKLNLPKRWSFIQKDKYQMAKMTCNNFGIVAMVDVNDRNEQHPLLVLKNVEAERKANELADTTQEDLDNLYLKYNETKKENFKP